MTKLKKNEYRCAACGEVYTKGWSDEEATTEAVSIWGDEVIETGVSVICDDCFQKGHQKIAGEMSLN